MEFLQKKSILKYFLLKINGLSYYTECLINLDYPNIIKLDLSNVGITSTQIMKNCAIYFINIHIL